MRRVCGVLACCLFCCLTLSIPIAIAVAAPIPPDIKKSVVFLFLPSGDGKLIPSGTGFLTGVRHPTKKGVLSVYLVTAKHVLQTPDRSGFVRQAFVRFNTKDGRSDVLTLLLSPEGPKKNVFVHADPAVDLAVVPVFEDPSRYDFKVIADELLTSKQDAERLGIREGAEVFYAGLFVPHVGVARNYPIVRFGKVALLPEEKINWGGRESDLYLIESASYGGNSGAPVFVFVPAAGSQERGPGPPAVRLAGVLVGYFGEVEAVGPQSGNSRTMAAYNTGVSAVVPAYKLQEILFGEELSRQRR
jgi:hypothetical protein